MARKKPEEEEEEEEEEEKEEEEKEEEEARLFVSDDEDSGTDANTAANELVPESADGAVSEAESFTSSIDANARALNLHGRGGGKDDPHSGCTTRAYLQDGQDYTGNNVRRCKAVRYNPAFATWCFCSRQKKCKPEINFTDKNGFVTCRTCHACRAHSETRDIGDKAERQKAKAAKIREWRDKARGGLFFHCGKPVNETPRRGPGSDDEDPNGMDGSSGGGIGGTLIAGH
ncbi:hypothetical protein CGRA01v4_06180 [Colletotrichum graminicola]|uniref:Uncharacterized protein n=1 Tax=Colletotrichum graminicola (strain M1.001 / M2 / FGSC 10212) TaxID=645133 RepID=E3QZ11_COLGM|nr:uncharacterized protein GLRG_11243 [Colletotrichum graminicola M1.001]EFQ36099.1 hypothetical protein GLRG_11243 [Colletotrichum graminicola M1.001]WDK14899.1 hypothetical protein CGRA01v4_06180 [Colletotrichum graminicola]